MSERARQSYSLDNLELIEKSYKIIATDIKTIEEVGGGSARSMMAELF